MDRRDRWARVAGVGLLGTFLGVLLEHGVAQSIGGTSLYGVRDAATVRAFYSHPSLATIYWLCAGLLLFLGAFGVGVRGYLRSHGAVVAADLVLLFVAVELPLLFAHYGLDIALVEVAPSGKDEVLLALLGVWNGVYHWVIEWTEVAWMVCLAWAAWKTQALPRWVSAWGALVAAGLGFNMIARLLHLPEPTMMPTYAAFTLWMLATAVVLLLKARTVDVAAEARVMVPAP